MVDFAKSLSMALVRRRGSQFGSVVIPRLLLPVCRSAALLACFSTTLIAVASPLFAFQVHRHWEMSRQILTDDLQVPFLAQQFILNGVVAPDLQDWHDGYCEPSFWPPCAPFTQPSPDDVLNVYSKRHFDNNQIEAGIAFVNESVDIARSTLFGWEQNPSVLNTYLAAYGLFRFGQALHAVQDFYAHSNYVELNNGVWASIDNIPLWDGFEDVQTGYFLLTPPQGGYAHAELNKDSPTSPSGTLLFFSPFGRLGTQYQAASGQLGGTGVLDPYGAGLAPRHTHRAFRALVDGISVFEVPFPKPTSRSPTAGGDIRTIISNLSADPRFASAAQEVATLLQNLNFDDGYSYPDSLLDRQTGLPFPYVTGGFTIETEIPIGFELVRSDPANECRGIILRSNSSISEELALSVSNAWLSVSQPMITLVPGGNASFELCLAPAAEQLAAGTYQDSCAILNQRTGIRQGIQVVLTILHRDADGDGYREDVDCDDHNSAIHPNAPDCVNGIDDDCDGQVDEGAVEDADHDGVTVCGGDCNDQNPTVFPGARELCDQLDNDCDGSVDEGVTADADHDHFTVCHGDCNDSNRDIHPGAVDICDGVDNDCDGRVDNEGGLDRDADGFTICGGDCNDDSADVYPGAPELCDNLDNNCNGTMDEVIRADADRDGVTICDGDCNDSNSVVHPGGTEICDSLDNDCNGTVDDGFDLDGDGFSRCQNDCDDNDFFVNPDADEVCDFRDNDCDGRIDEGCGLGEPVAGEFPLTFTTDDDFDNGALFNVNHHTPNHDQLQLDEMTRPLPYVNIANSERGTIVRINVNNGAILGEYFTAPNGMGRDPSRTTVDKFGNVWVSNRAEAGFSGGQNKGSVTRVGVVIGGTRVDADGRPNPSGRYLKPPFNYNTCVDRDGDGLIKTSSRLGDILPWTNAGGADTHGGVSTAEDECIINYTRVVGTNTRTVAVDANNDVWTGGLGDLDHEKISGVTGLPVPGTQFNAGCGGYGGLVDGNNVLWSARGGANLLRYDVDATSGACLDASHGDYGLGIDPRTGEIWHTNLFGNRVAKLATTGTLIAAYGHGDDTAQGVVVDGVGNVWVAHSLIGPRTTVGHLRTDGTFVGNVPLPGGAGPTGVAVDANGKVWVANYNSNNAMRIDPNAGPIGGGGFPVGVVDLVVDLGPGASPYNYSDMTGFVAIGSTAPQGTWTVVCNSGVLGLEWGTVGWNELAPAGTDVRVEVRAADVLLDLASVPYREVQSGERFEGVFGQFLDVRVTMARGAGVTASPVLYDLTVSPLNEPPDCSATVASVTELWPPAHKFGFVPVAIGGITDPDGDPVAVTVLGVSSDEVVDDGGDGETCPDAIIDGAQVQLRAERSGLGDGRVYTIHFRAEDGRGGACVDSVTVCVPHDQGIPPQCIESALVADATSCSAVRHEQGRAQASVGSLALYQPGPNPFRHFTRMGYEVTDALGEDVQVSVYDVAGRRIRRLVSSPYRPGRYEVVWDGTSENGSKIGAGIYFIRVNQSGKRPRIARVVHLQ